VTIRNVYLDCEFLTADPTISGLVSIGLCDDDGAEYYAVNNQMDVPAAYRHPWMRENVWRYLPTRDADGFPQILDRAHSDTKDVNQIATEIADWFAATTAETTRLWAWHGGQDICRLHLLWNNDWQAMPEQVPRWFNEIEQLRWQAGNPELPEQDGGAHNALSDARHNRTMREFLIARLATRGE
jgi:hypothetical protein